MFCQVSIGNTLITICLKEAFKEDYISRAAGERLRNSIIAAEQKGESITLDFTGLVIASTSFFDEGFAKLVKLGWNQDKLFQVAQLKNIHPKDKILLEDIIRRRQEK